jgi:hypothetical protein
MICARAGGAGTMPPPRYASTGPKPGKDVVETNELEPMLVDTPVRPTRQAFAGATEVGPCRSVQST